jgi:hypothetical protein
MKDYQDIDRFKKRVRGGRGGGLWLVVLYLCSNIGTVDGNQKQIECIIFAVFLTKPAVFRIFKTMHMSGYSGGFCLNFIQSEFRIVLC